MSLIDLSDKRPSPGLSLNLSSNNPFRNRTGSPAFPSPQTPLSAPGSAPPRPTTRNPFLDINTSDAVPNPIQQHQQTRTASPHKMSLANDVSGPQRPAMAGNTADLFNALTLDEKLKPNPAQNSRMPPHARSNTYEKGMTGPSRPENVPPRTDSVRHRPSRSQEEAMRARKAAGSSSRRTPSGELNIFADPSDSPKKSESSRRRRNSDSSTVRSSTLRMPETDEERRRRRREREKRHRERDAKDPKTRKPPKNLDIIDKLDVTSIYGTGLFHHDGPFDACNPHRNRKGSQRAPMQAFPKDSLNNIMGGGGPLNKRPDHATFLGNNDGEAFKDFSTEAYGNGAIRPIDDLPRHPATMVNPLAPEIIYGEESLGLGASTFLEGTPASREAIARRQESAGGGADLQRKKSLAQKIRGIRNERRDYGPSGRITSPDGVTSPGSPYTPGGSRRTEVNPFAGEFSSTVEKKLENVNISESERPAAQHSRAPSSPKRYTEGLQRRATSDSNDGGFGESSKTSGGFLSRVKSLKGGPRKPRDPKNLG